MTYTEHSFFSEAQNSSLKCFCFEHVFCLILMLFINFLAVLGIQPRPLHMLSKELT